MWMCKLIWDGRVWLCIVLESDMCREWWKMTEKRAGLMMPNILKVRILKRGKDCCSKSRCKRKIVKKAGGVKQKDRKKEGIGARGRMCGVGCWQSETERQTVRKRGICAHQESSEEHKRLKKKDLGRRSWVKEEAERNSGRWWLPRQLMKGVKWGILKEEKWMEGWKQIVIQKYVSVTG